jgi:hypothetical protein
VNQTIGALNKTLVCQLSANVWVARDTRPSNDLFT